MSDRVAVKRPLTETAALLLSLCLLTVVPAGPVEAQTFRYSLGLGYGLQSARGGDFFDLEGDFGLVGRGSLSPGPRWELTFEAATFRQANTRTDSTAALDGFPNSAPLDFKSFRLGASLDRLLLPEYSTVNFLVGGGGGLVVWKMADRHADTAYNVAGSRGERTDFSAAELFVRATAGVRLRVSPRVTLDIRGSADYLTGAGAEFAAAVDEARDRLLLGVGAGLSFRFGRRYKPAGWSDLGLPEPDSTLLAVRPSEPDSDGDGVPDRLDRCPGTPAGVRADQYGCPLDTDGDGVYDGLDDCPGTPPEAAGAVDIFGCAVDRDFDGVPDWADACPDGPVGGVVDSAGCPLDGDGDGVPDGLDDCPYTLVGVEVDKRGCIDLSMLDTPMVLNIDYAPGSFEIDPHNRRRLKRLAGLLNFVTDIKLEIYGYTDNIGTARANQRLSEKRARRVRDFLVAQGVAAERIQVFGRGETNFIASNRTAEGRARNRRIEIVFRR